MKRSLIKCFPVLTLILFSACEKNRYVNPEEEIKEDKLENTKWEAFYEKDLETGKDIYTYLFFYPNNKLQKFVMLDRSELLSDTIENEYYLSDTIISLVRWGTDTTKAIYNKDTIKVPTGDRYPMFYEIE